MGKNRWWLGTALVFLLGAAPVSAEVLILKDGRKVEGTIYDQSKDWVKMRIHGVPAIYFRSEIKKILQDGETEEERPDEEDKDTMDPQDRELILRLLDANGARDAMNRIFLQIAAQAPEKDRPKIRDLLRTDEILDRLVPIYARFYTIPEIKELLRFYKTPTGRKSVEITPKIVDASMKAAAAYFQERLGLSGAEENPSEGTVREEAPGTDSGSDSL